MITLYKENVILQTT